MLRRAFIALLVSLCGSVAWAAADKPVVFIHLSVPRTELDDLAYKYFDRLYNVVAVDDREHAYSFPKGTSGFGPTPAAYIGNRCVAGKVLTLYVITDMGLVTSAYAVKSTDPALAQIAIRLMSERRFQPAQLDGKPIAVIAASRFMFRCPARPAAGIPPRMAAANQFELEP